MFKDRKEELHRLEEELLWEEEAARLEEELEEADPLLDDPDDYGEETEETYYNYYNQYGTANAYNADLTDADLDAFSEQVYEGKVRRRHRRLIVLALTLLAAIMCVLAWCALRFTGVL